MLTTTANNWSAMWCCNLCLPHKEIEAPWWFIYMVCVGTLVGEGFLVKSVTKWVLTGEQGNLWGRRWHSDDFLRWRLGWLATLLHLTQRMVGNLKECTIFLKWSLKNVQHRRSYKGDMVLYSNQTTIEEIEHKWHPIWRTVKIKVEFGTQIPHRVLTIPTTWKSQHQPSKQSLMARIMSTWVGNRRDNY